MKRFLKILLKVAVPLGVSVGLCWIMFSQVPLGQVIEDAREHCRVWPIIVMLLMGLLPMLFRAMRWRLQLRAIGVEVPLHILFYSIFGTYSVNLVFPRLGEIWRTGYIARRQEASFGEVFGSMVADRLADLATVGVLVVITMAVAIGPLREFLQAYPDAYNALAHLLGAWWFWGAIAVAGVAGYIVVFRLQNPVSVKLRGFVVQLWQGFAALAKMQGKGEWLLLTVAIWGSYFVQLVVAFFAFEATEQLLWDYGLTVPLICFTLTSISNGIPSQGGIGPYQTVMKFALTPFLLMAAGMAGEGAGEAAGRLAIVFGNVIIASQTIFLIIGGLIVFLLIARDRA